MYNEFHNPSLHHIACEEHSCSKPFQRNAAMVANHWNSASDLNLGSPAPETNALPLDLPTLQKSKNMDFINWTIFNLRKKIKLLDSFFMPRSEITICIPRPNIELPCYCLALTLARNCNFLQNQAHKIVLMISTRLRLTTEPFSLSSENNILKCKGKFVALYSSWA